MADFETITYEEANGVAWVTLDRPEVHNAFNTKMTQEQALDQAYTFIAMGTDAEALRAGQESFASGRRQERRLR